MTCISIIKLKSKLNFDLMCFFMFFYLKIFKVCSLVLEVTFFDSISNCSSSKALSCLAKKIIYLRHCQNRHLSSWEENRFLSSS